jgi:hypothetical protein
MGGAAFSLSLGLAESWQLIADSLFDSRICY